MRLILNPCIWRKIIQFVCHIFNSSVGDFCEPIEIKAQSQCARPNIQIKTSRTNQQEFRQKKSNINNNNNKVNMKVVVIIIIIKR